MWPVARPPDRGGLGGSVHLPPGFGATGLRPTRSLAWHRLVLGPRGVGAGPSAVASPAGRARRLHRCPAAAKRMTAAPTLAAVPCLWWTKHSH